MKDWWKIVISVLGTLLAVALIQLISAKPRGYPIQLEPLPSPSPLVVHVVGAVFHPAVYRLPAHSRVEDAIQAAGGFSPDANPKALNLAAWIEDGMQIAVPSLHESVDLLQENPITSNLTAETTPDPFPAEQTTSAVQTTPTMPKPTFPINLNTATSLELELLPQIGPVRAARIVAYREANGPFQKIEDVRKVYDISEEVYAEIRDLITVQGVTSSNPESSRTPSVTPQVQETGSGL